MSLNPDPTPYLDADERVLWQGRPDPLGYAAHTGLFSSVATGVAFIVIAALTLVPTLPLVRRALSAPPAHTDFFSMPPFPSPTMSPGLSVGLIAMLALIAGVGLVMVSLPLWRILLARQTRYVLTNRRAIIEISGRATRRTSSLTNLPFIEIRPGSNGRGHILFANAAQTWSRIPQKDGFIAIAEPERVERLLLQGASARVVP